MSNNEQELKLTDIARENDNEGKKTESIADILRRNKEEQVGQIESFNFADIGYTEKEVEQNGKFRQALDQYIEESGDDPKKFLDSLAQQGIRVVENSSFLSSQQSTQQFLGRLTGRGESGINALFATQDMVNNYISGDLLENVKRELEDALSSQGTIFLSKRPNPKSIFHEGSHAVQHLSGMDMDAKDEETKLRREIEVNTALIHAKNTGKLGNVSRGEYRIGKGPFGETATLGSNDIYQEVDYFLGNKAKLEKIILERRKTDDEKASASKIDKIREELRNL